MKFFKTGALVAVLASFFILAVPFSVFASTQTYYYPNGYEVKETPAGRETSRYIPVGPVTVLEKGNKTYYLHPDQVASTALITDQQGNRVQELAYYPYGKTFKSQTPESDNSTDRLYTSQIKDRTNLYFYNARYYNPRTASFISADYANDQANRGNRYLYVGGSPIARNDPGGTCSLPNPFSPSSYLGGIDCVRKGINAAKAVKSGNLSAVQAGIYMADELTGSFTSRLFNDVNTVFYRPDLSTSKRFLSAVNVGLFATSLGAGAAGRVVGEGASAIEASLENTENITLYKGVSSYDGGDILPGGLSKSPHYMYQAGEISSDALPEPGIAQALKHMILGETSQSPFSSWTLDYNLAEKYSTGGNVVKATFKPGEVLSGRNVLKRVGRLSQIGDYLPQFKNYNLEQFYTPRQNWQNIMMNDEYLFHGILDASRVTVVR